MDSRHMNALEGIRGALAALPSQTDLRWMYGALCMRSQQALDAWTPGSPKGPAPFQVMDFFSGCGGMSLGFAALSSLVGCFQLIGAVDIDADARRSYEANFGVPCIGQDVKQIASTPMNTRRLLNLFPEYDPTKPLILIGCAPCQGFTSHRKKTWTETDPRNTLVADFVRIAVRLKPVAIVIENVPELLSVKYWPYFAAARDILTAHGYVVRQGVVNSASYAVPQDRRRALVMAYRNDFLLPYPPEETRHSLVTVRDAIGTLPAVTAGQQDANDPMHRSASHKSSTLQTICAVPHDGGSRPAGVGPKCLDRVSGYSDVYGRLRWDKPSITVTKYARNPASGRYVHPEQDRGLTMREAARLQSFPDGFLLSGTLDSVFKQIGEAVPARLACCIASSIVLELMAPPPEHHDEPGVDLVVEPRFNTYAGKTRYALPPPMRTDSSSRLTCIDAFSGAGGMRLGLQWAGIDVIYAFDLDTKCVATQNMNTAFSTSPAEQADIRELLHGNLLRKTALEPGQLFLLSGGPPCQGFSIQRIGADEDVRDDLVLAYLELIGELMPRYFLMENVPGILGARGKSYSALLLAGVQKIGYSVSLKTLNVADYGVPQRRKRVIVIGARDKGINLDNVFPTPSTPEGFRVTVRDAIGMLPPPPDDPGAEPTIPNHVRDRLSPLNLRRLAAVGPGEGRVNLPPELLAACHLRPADEIGHRNVYGRMEWNKVAPTITARFDSFTRGQFGHPDQLRSITLREGALLQSFPIDFGFCGTKVEVARQIGNAVPPLFARALGEAIMAHFRTRSTGD